MEYSQIISVNLWQILISLANLLILFLLLKKFLYKPVKKVLAQRQKKIEDDYANADKALASAQNTETMWNEKMACAGKEAENIRKKAISDAEKRGDAIVADAREKAQDIVKVAENDAKQMHLKAEKEIHDEIVGVSVELTKKMLDREIDEKDHKDLIDSFITEMEKDE